VHLGDLHQQPFRQICFFTYLCLCTGHEAGHEPNWLKAAEASDKSVPHVSDLGPSSVILCPSFHQVVDQLLMPEQHDSVHDSVNMQRPLMPDSNAVRLLSRSSALVLPEAKPCGPLTASGIGVASRTLFSSRSSNSVDLAKNAHANHSWLGCQVPLRMHNRAPGCAHTPGGHRSDVLTWGWHPQPAGYQCGGPHAVSSAGAHDSTARRLWRETPTQFVDEDETKAVWAMVRACYTSARRRMWTSASAAHRRLGHAPL